MPAGGSPRGLFDLVIGINRWSYRLVLYVALMTDRYPPSGLTGGRVDPEGPAESGAAQRGQPVAHALGTGVRLRGVCTMGSISSSRFNCSPAV
jgi:hypothetical protein